jgi:hypothetical protein
MALPPDGQPYHTTTDEVPYGQRNIHYNRNICPDGKRIEPYNLEWDDGGKPLCDWCKSHLG